MISDKNHPEGKRPTDRLVTWYTKARVTGYGTEPEPHLILRLTRGPSAEPKYLHMPMAGFDAIKEWPMRSEVNLKIEMDNLP